MPPQVQGEESGLRAGRTRKVWPCYLFVSLRVPACLAVFIIVVDACDCSDTVVTVLVLVNFGVVASSAANAASVVVVLVVGGVVVVAAAAAAVVVVVVVVLVVVFVVVVV